MKHPTLALFIISVVVLTTGTPAQPFNNAVVVQKKIAFTRLNESGLTQDQAETYSMYLQIALGEATQWELLDFSVTASLIAERGGTSPCRALNCSIVNGQLLDVDYICFGTIETIGRTFSLNVQVADVRSGRLVANVSKFFKGKEKVFTNKVIPQIARQLATTLGATGTAGKSQQRPSPSSFENMVKQQSEGSFSDVRGYLSYGSSDPQIETAGKLAFGYLLTGRRMRPDDVLRYSYQLQSYLADVGACAMLYIDEMERLMQMRGGNLQCGSSKCAKSVGRLLGVDYMGYGKIRRLFGKYIIRAYIVDVETGETVTSVKDQFRGREIIFLTEVIPQLAYKLGEVLERKQIGKN